MIVWNQNRSKELVNENFVQARRHRFEDYDHSKMGSATEEISQTGKRRKTKSLKSYLYTFQLHTMR